MKKIVCCCIVLVMMFVLCCCGSAPTNDTMKMGLICLHDENSPYDYNFISAFEDVCKSRGIKYAIKTNVDESNSAYEAACELADSGCTIVFGDSFGFEDYLIQAAVEFPNVEFCHATGVKAHTEDLDNYHNAFASIYEGRYIDGVVAGLKLKEMTDEDNICVGYVGAFDYAEVISGYTSFFLGVRSIYPSATMKVIYTGSWYDETLEKEAANRLIKSGCVLLSGHADSMGLPNACESANIPFVFYNNAVTEACPNTFIVATKIDWRPYFNYILDCVINGTSIATDWTGDFTNGAVAMSEVNSNVAAKGTIETINGLIEGFKADDIKVFDTSTFTVGGSKIVNCLADVDSDEAYTGDTDVVFDGYFHESEFRSAPYFDLKIDGIEVVG